MIDLSRCTTVKSADLKAHKKHSFEVSTPDTTYLLYAGEVCFDFMWCDIVTQQKVNLIRHGINTNDIPNCLWTSFYTIRILLWLTKDDEKAKDDWIGSVGRAIVRCSSTYVSNGGQAAQGGKGGNGNNLDTMNEEYDDDSSDYSNSSNNPYFND